MNALAIIASISSAGIVAIGVAVVVLLAAAALFTTARRRDVGSATGYLSRETRARDKGRPAVLAEPKEEVLVAAPTGREIERAAADERAGVLVPAGSHVPAPYIPPDAETLGVSRRQFFNRSAVALMGVSLAGFGAACLAFLWPSNKGGFGSKITVGKLSDIKSGIDAGKGFYYVPEARTWITAYPAGALPKAEKIYAAPVFEGMKNGIVALYQKCPHLGCRVPQCVTSQWFECPCHGSQYNRVGEKKGGPAPRGMDRFGVSVSGDVVTVDTSLPYLGPTIGTNTTGQEAEGPHCISSAGGHG